MKRIASVASAVLGAMLFASCGGGDDEKASTPVTVKGFEYGYEMPAEVKGGLAKMTFENTGGQVHEWALGKLAPGVTEQQVNDFLNSPKGQSASSTLFTDVGGVPIMSPQTKIGVTRSLTPGSYMFICPLPGPNGKSHLELGMLKGFKVTGEAGESPPAADGTITETAKAIEVTPLKAGAQTIEFKNAGDKTSGIQIYSLAPGKTFKDIEKWGNGGLKGEPPATFYGGIQKVKAGASSYIDIELKPGVEYVVFDDESGLQKTFQAG